MSVALAEFYTSPDGKMAIGDDGSGNPTLVLTASAGVTPAYADLVEAIPVGICTGALTMAENVYVKPSGTEIRYLFSTDNGETWQTWTGAVWVATVDPLGEDFAEALDITALTPTATQALNMASGLLLVRVFMVTDTIGVTPALLAIDLTVDRALPVEGLLLPTRGYYDTDVATVITPGDGGDEERWQRYEGLRRSFGLKWQNLTTDRYLLLLAWWSWATTYRAFDFVDPSDGVTYTVRFLGPGLAMEPSGIGTTRFYNGTATLVEVDPT